jgi:hypothetical protein
MIVIKMVSTSGLHQTNTRPTPYRLQGTSRPSRQGLLKGGEVLAPSDGVFTFGGRAAVWYAIAREKDAF